MYECKRTEVALAFVSVQGRGFSASRLGSMSKFFRVYGPGFSVPSLLVSTKKALDPTFPRACRKHDLDSDNDLLCSLNNTKNRKSRAPLQSYQTV